MINFYQAPNGLLRTNVCDTLYLGDLMEVIILWQRGHPLNNWGDEAGFSTPKSCIFQPFEGMGLRVCIYGIGSWNICPCRKTLLYSSSRLTDPVTVVPRSKPSVFLHVALREEPGVWDHLDLSSTLNLPLWIWVIYLTSLNLTLHQ